MVHNDLWERATGRVGPRGGGVLCLACLSKRLKRALVPEDFTELPIVHEPLPADFVRRLEGKKLPARIQSRAGRSARRR